MIDSEFIEKCFYGRKLYNKEALLQKVNANNMVDIIRNTNGVNSTNTRVSASNKL